LRFPQGAAALTQGVEVIQLVADRRLLESFARRVDTGQAVLDPFGGVADEVLEEEAGATPDAAGTVPFRLCLCPPPGAAGGGGVGRPSGPTGRRFYMSLEGRGSGEVRPSRQPVPPPLNRSITFAESSIITRLT
jgi:hypothetical protein